MPATPQDRLPARSAGTRLATLDAFAEVPEEEIWLRNFTSRATRLAPPRPASGDREAARNADRNVGRGGVPD